MQAEPLGLDGLAQAELGARALVDRLAQHLVEDDGLVAALGLRGVQRHVGLPEQVHAVLRAALGDDDTDAGGVADELAGDLDGSTHDVEDPVGAGEHLHLARRVVDEDDELVAAEARGEVVGADGRADPVGDGREQPVAVGVAEEVVHDLEPVEVEDQDGGRAVRRRAGPSARAAARGGWRGR